MDSLPQELFDYIVSELSESSKAMLSITCKQMRGIRKRSILDSCVLDGDYKLVQLAESWGAQWKKTTYKCLGNSNSVFLLNMCLPKTQAKLKLVALSAVVEGNYKILEYLHKSGKTKGALQDEIINTAITLCKFEVLLVYVQSPNKWYCFAQVALVRHNKDLFQFCCLHEPGCSDPTRFLRGTFKPEWVL